MVTVMGFRGEYRFLSNFYVLNKPVTIEFFEWTLPASTVEHAYQASKATSLEDARYVISAQTQVNRNAVDV